jgi:hypothetical protein
MTLVALNTGALTIRQQVMDHILTQVGLIDGVGEVRYRLPGSDQMRKPVRQAECPLAYVYDGPDDERFDLDKYTSKAVNTVSVGVALVDTFDPVATNDSPENLLRKGNRYVGALLLAVSDTELDWPGEGLNVDATTPQSAFIAELATSDDGALLIAGIQVAVAYWTALDNPFSQ